MTDKTNPQISINMADQSYVNAIFQALMNYQAIEDLLRDCIIKSYEILDSSSHDQVTFHPPKEHIKKIQKKMGLGGLVDTFCTLTHHKDLCERIKKEASIRNEIAHRAAADSLNFTVSEDGAKECWSKAIDIFLAAEKANSLYLELREVQQGIIDTHNELI